MSRPEWSVMLDEWMGEEADARREEAGRMGWRAFWRGLALGAALGFAIGLAASAAFAAAAPRMTLGPAEGACFATIRVENRNGWYQATEVIHTPRGAVSIRYQTVGSHAPGNDDRIEVTSLPNDVIAQPMEATIPDGAGLTVCLLEYLGG